MASVVERTVEHSYFKMTISQGIVLDPRHPGEATVFVLAIPPGKLDSLRDQLNVALADQVDERAADPKVMTQLAGIGQVQTRRTDAIADVSIPRAAVALMHHDPGSGETSASPDGMSSSQVPAPTPEQAQRTSPTALDRNRTRRHKPVAGTRLEGARRNGRPRVGLQAARAIGSQCSLRRVSMALRDSGSIWEGEAPAEPHLGGRGSGRAAFGRARLRPSRIWEGEAPAEPHLGGRGSGRARWESGSPGGSPSRNRVTPVTSGSRSLIL